MKNQSSYNLINHEHAASARYVPHRKLQPKKTEQQKESTIQM